MKKIIAVVPLLVVLSLFLLPTGTLSQVTAQVTLSFESFANFLTNQPTATAINPTDKLLVIQGGVTKQAPGSLVTGGGGGGGGGVTTFNGRSGAVSPQTGDYAFSNISGSVAASQLPTPTASTLGGVESGTAPGSEFVTGINTSGQLTYATPAGSGNVSTTGSPVTGNCAQFTGSTTITSAAAPCGSGGSGTNLGWVNIKTFGATGDGTCHPLSSAYATLAAAQAVYPFVSDLTQCIDWAAIQQAINTAYTLSGNNSSTVYCPVGDYRLSNPLFFDQPNNTQGSNPAWAVGSTYGNGALVTYNGIPWISSGSGNVGNPPTSANFFPTGLSAAFSSFNAVQISNGSPAVVTFVANGLPNGTPLVFSTQLYPTPPAGATPALPTGINANQVYYVINRATNTFQVSATPGGSAVNTTSAGVGTFFTNTQVWQVSPNTASTGFSNRISFMGDPGLSEASGCQLKTAVTQSGGVYLGPQSGVLVENIALYGPHFFTNDTTYRCQMMDGLGGWIQQDNGGGSSVSKFVNVRADSFRVGFVVGVGSGALADSNTWDKSTISNNCVGIYFNESQAFINTAYDSLITFNTTAIKADIQTGMKVIGGNDSVSSALANNFSISSVSLSNVSNNYYVTATIASPDLFLLSPMCAYAAGREFNLNGTPAQYAGASVPLGNSCGYNNWTIVTPHFGLVPMYLGAFNPFTGVATFVIPSSWKAIYQNACCGTQFQTDIQAATTIYAAEMVTTWYGNIQVDTNHIENPNVPTTMMYAQTAFGAGLAAEVKNVTLNAPISLGPLICCNQVLAANLLGKPYAQQTTPFINAFNTDIILDSINGGQDNIGGERALIGIQNNTYLEGRHTQTKLQNIGIGTPFFDFQVGSAANVTATATGTGAAGQNGQLSAAYRVFGGQAWGGGIWDNASWFASRASESQDILTTGLFSDVPELWRQIGWGQGPSWGVRPAPWSSPCITPAQYTTLTGTLPAITYISTLTNLNVASGGNGYAVGDTITLAGGTATPQAQVQVTAISGGLGTGPVTAVTVIRVGAYTTEPATLTQGSTSGGGTLATFTSPIWYVNYNIPYPMLWGGQVYHACDFTSGTFTAGKYAVVQGGTGYSYLQNLTTTNVPNLAWTMDGSSPFIYMNQEALELMFQGLVLSLTSDGTGGCPISAEKFMVLETHITLGYVKVIRADADGSPFIPGWGAGITCKNNVIGQAGVTFSNPY